VNSLYNFPNFLVSSFLLSPNILFNVLLSSTLNFHFLLRVKGQVSSPYRTSPYSQGKQKECLKSWFSGLLYHVVMCRIPLFHRAFLPPSSPLRWRQQCVHHYSVTTQKTVTCHLRCWGVFGCRSWA